MKSICIKMTSPKKTEYLLEKLNTISLDNVYFSCKKFKIYYNIIIHYCGKNNKIFVKTISKILSSFTTDILEQKLIRKLILCEYFYFTKNEQMQIENITYNDLYDKEESIYNSYQRFNVLYNSFYNYLCSNKSIVLKGFITFRIKKYLQFLLEQIDNSVNKFIIQKEYTDLISTLKTYVSFEPSTIEVVHIIYSNCKPTLLDDNKNIININDNKLNAKYLSDISFSSNDYALNSLLSLVPKRIFIHLIDKSSDEFINTIKLIFEGRVTICTDCSICQMYKKIHALQN